jgi:hypothetical protein
MWAIIESTVDYSTSDVFELYGVIAAVSLVIVVVMFKTACNKEND